MKIYHTETQEDYDALMVELEEQGIGTLGKRYWEVYENQTVVIVHALCRPTAISRTDTAYGSLEWALQTYPNVPIQKYKVKADEKMRFTKENVITKIDEWADDKETSLNELKASIRQLEEEEPEKVVVPKCFDDYYKGFTERCGEGETAMRNAVQKVSQYGFGYPLENQHNERLDNDTDLSSWVLENKLVAINAILNGYTIAPEPLYVIPLENLVTSDGVQQYLSYDATGQNYFASRPQGGLKQKYTNDELQDVPEGYKTFAVLVEEEK